MQRKQVTLNDFGMLIERYVDDGLKEDDFVFVAVVRDLSDYEFVPGTGEQITKLAIAARLEPLAVATKGKNWEFHKTDADPWPSRLHGHFYDAGINWMPLPGSFTRSRPARIAATSRTRNCDVFSSPYSTTRISPSAPANTLEKRA